MSSSILPRSNITACNRCRKRKQKCDQRLPTCRSCEKAGVECVGTDAVTKRAIPRSYVHSLEERVAFLETQLQRQGFTNLDTDAAAEIAPITPQRESVSTPSICLSQTTGAVSRDLERRESARSMLKEHADTLGVESYSKQSYTEVLLQELYDIETPRAREPALSEQNSFFLTSDDETQPVGNPGPEEIEQLVTVFFELANFSNPILHEPTFRNQLESVLHEESPSPQQKFFAHIVFAIALLTLQKHGSARVSTTLCERYFSSALRCLSWGKFLNCIEGVQALLLIAFYSYVHPQTFNPRNAVDMAVRLAVELGLHLEPEPGRFDALALDTRRRVFWVAYSMDRIIGIILQRPFAISDGAIRTEFPSEVQDECITRDGIASNGTVGRKAFSLQYFRYRKLLSEIYVTLYEKPYPSSQGFAYGAWQQDMQARINQWLYRQPSNASSTNIAPVEALELSYHHALVMLYRPSPQLPATSDAGMLILAESSTHLIQLYRRLYKENKLRLLWQAVHYLFCAGTALIHCYNFSEEVRRRMSFRMLHTKIHDCSAVLWAMAERFPSAKGKRDAFDSISSAALDALSEEVIDAHSTASHSGAVQAAMQLTTMAQVQDSLDLGAWPTMDQGPDVLGDLSISPGLLEGNVGWAGWL